MPSYVSQKKIIYSTIAGFLPICLTPAAAYATQKTYDLAQQSLSNALQAYAIQTDIELFAPSELIKGKQSSSLSDTYLWQEAFNRLLVGNSCRSLNG